MDARPRGRCWSQVSKWTDQQGAWATEVMINIVIKRGPPGAGLLLLENKILQPENFPRADLTIAYLGLEQKMRAQGKVEGYFPRGPRDFGLSFCLTQETAAVTLTGSLCS